jgi:hypothetical protein
MAVAVGSIGHEDRLSLVDHLQELRGLSVLIARIIEHREIRRTAADALR